MTIDSLSMMDLTLISQTIDATHRNLIVTKVGNIICQSSRWQWVIGSLQQIDGDPNSEQKVQKTVPVSFRWPWCDISETRSNRHQENGAKDVWRDCCDLEWSSSMYSPHSNRQPIAFNLIKFTWAGYNKVACDNHRRSRDVIGHLLFQWNSLIFWRSWMASIGFDELRLRFVLCGMHHFWSFWFVIHRRWMKSNVVLSTMHLPEQVVNEQNCRCESIWRPSGGADENKQTACRTHED